MPFKESERVIYEKSSLIEVVCQLRFPRILSINEKDPVDFQERIRGQYPMYNFVVEQQQFLVPQGINTLPPIVQNEQVKNHTFFSVDGVWRVNLTSTFLSLTTSSYSRWEDFLKHLEEPLRALTDIYKPTFFERIGLRYVNAIRRTLLSIDKSTPWKELIEPFALGFLSYDEVASDVKGYTSNTDISIGENAFARIITSTGFVGNEMFQPNPEESFIIDSDLFFGIPKQLNESNNSLEYLHSYAGKLIRSIITEKLHKAMEPKII